jgi:hypothetical protein
MSAENSKPLNFNPDDFVIEPPLVLDAKKILAKAIWPLINEQWGKGDWQKKSKVGETSRIKRTESTFRQEKSVELYLSSFAQANLIRRVATLAIEEVIPSSEGLIDSLKDQHATLKKAKKIDDDWPGDEGDELMIRRGLDYTFEQRGHRAIISPLEYYVYIENIDNGADLTLPQSEDRTKALTYEEHDVDTMHAAFTLLNSSIDLLDQLLEMKRVAVMKPVEK